MFMLTTSALRDYVYLMGFSDTCRLLETTGESAVVTDECCIDLSRLQSTIKMIHLIIPTAVRKGY